MKSGLKKLWPHLASDKRTWKYSNVVIGGTIENGTAYVKRWVLNPSFKYKHLDRSYEKEYNIAMRKCR